MKTYFILAGIFLHSISYSQIPESIIQDGELYVDSIVGFLKGADVLHFNCDQSYINMVGQNWPACPAKADEEMPDLTEYHQLALYETYHLFYDFKGHVGIPALVELVLDRKGKMVTHNQYLQDCFIRNYEHLRYGPEGARNIAQKLGLDEGKREWVIELLCTDLGKNNGEGQLNEPQLFWTIRNVTDLGDGCNITGHSLIINASNGSLTAETPYGVQCID